MAIAFSCTSCEASMKVRDNLAGRKVKCPKCGELTRVPDEYEEEEDRPARARTRREQDDDEDRPRRKSRPAIEDDEDEEGDEDQDRRLTHKEKVAYMIKDLKRRGVGPSTSAPPVFRLLWALGVKVPPPLFLGFLPTLLIVGSVAGVLWGGMMWVLQWRGMDMPMWLAVAGAAAFGLLFGSTMGFYVRWKAKKLGLPPWSRYPRRSRRSK
jgi:predicted Zn finger-like uncharacterized protein